MARLVLEAGRITKGINPELEILGKLGLFCQGEETLCQGQGAGRFIAVNRSE